MIGVKPNANNAQIAAKNIADVLYRVGILSKTDYYNLANQSNSFIENYLKTKLRFRDELILKAYAVFYKIPIVALDTINIDPKILSFFPIEEIRKFKVLPYASAESRLSLAVGDALILEKKAPDLLFNLAKRHHIQLNLALVLRSRFDKILNDYDKIVSRANKNELMSDPVYKLLDELRREINPQISVLHEDKKSEIVQKESSKPDFKSDIKNIPQILKTEQKPKNYLPLINIADRKIPYEVISRFPQDIARKYEMVVFEQIYNKKDPKKLDSVKVGLLNPNNQGAQKVIDLVKDINHIQVEQYKIDKKSYEHALEAYKNFPTKLKASEVDQKPLKPSAISPDAVQNKKPDQKPSQQNQAFWEEQPPKPIDLGNPPRPEQIKKIIDEKDTGEKSEKHESFLEKLIKPKSDKEEKGQKDIKEKSVSDTIQDQKAVDEQPQITSDKTQETKKSEQSQAGGEKILNYNVNYNFPPPITPKSTPVQTDRGQTTPTDTEGQTEPLADQTKPQEVKPASPTIQEKIIPPTGIIAVQEAEIKMRPDSSGGEQTESNAWEQSNLDKFLNKTVVSPQSLADAFKTGLVPQIVASLVSYAVEMKASDIHIEPEEKNLRIRYRIDGELQEIVRVPLFLHASIVSRIKILSKLKIDEQRIPQDGRFTVSVTKHQIDLRISTMPTIHGEKIVMRVLDKSLGVYTLEQLGVTGTGFEALVENIKRPYGVILATGPTGSGKSTTLYAILNRISKPDINVITLEDPVEYELPGINQCQVKPKIGFTFAEGLRSVLRQDPNVIMVGEIRDAETAGMATHAALTGHLVLSTLHTNDASGALPRLINMGIEPFLITSSINVVIAQRLVRKICQKCKQEYDVPENLKSEIKKEIAELKNIKVAGFDETQLKFYKGKGCSECTNGYKGRIGIYEVLPMSDKIEELAVSKAPASEIAKAAIAEGMITMKQDGILKALKGVTSIEEVLRVTTTS